MSFIIICGPQAVGKMTVGRCLEKAGIGRLLYNHQTIDLYAHFLGYTEAAFQLSEQTRFHLFRAFAENTATNSTDTLIFTVMLDFDNPADWGFLNKSCQIFLAKKQPVYCLELTATVTERLQRNIHEERLAAKPSKRDLVFSRKDLLDSAANYRLNSAPQEFAEKLPQVQHLCIDNTQLTPEAVRQKVLAAWPELVK